jgi:hypothetical protein
MRRPRRARLVAAAALPLASAVLVAGCGAASTVSPASGLQVITVTYAGGVITPPESRVPVKLGGKVEIRVTSDVAEIVHNHFDNDEQDVAAGGTAVFDFTADKPGIYEVELHKADKLLLELQVQ